MSEFLEAVQSASLLSDEAAEEFYRYGYAQYKNGDAAKAAETFRVLCDERPLEPRNWFGLGAACQVKKDYDTALRAWSMVALLEPNDPYPHFHAAECAFSRHQIEEAALALKEAENRTWVDHPLKERISILKEVWKA